MYPTLTKFGIVCSDSSMQICTGAIRPNPAVTSDNSSLRRGQKTTASKSAMCMKLTLARKCCQLLSPTYANHMSQLRGKQAKISTFSNEITSGRIAVTKINQIEKVWTTCKKPFLKSGALLFCFFHALSKIQRLVLNLLESILLNQVDEATRFCLVNDKSRRTFRVRTGICLEDLLSTSSIIDSPLLSVPSLIEEGTGNYLFDVRVAHLDSFRTGKPGLESHKPIMCIGKLRNSKPYFF